MIAYVGLYTAGEAWHVPTKKVLKILNWVEFEFIELMKLFGCPA
jgi:hypothetical protein